MCLLQHPTSEFLFCACKQGVRCEKEAAEKVRCCAFHEVCDPPSLLQHQIVTSTHHCFNPGYTYPPTYLWITSNPNAAFCVAQIETQTLGIKFDRSLSTMCFLFLWSSRRFLKENVSNPWRLTIRRCGPTCPTPRLLPDHGAKKNSRRVACTERRKAQRKDWH